jgi:3-(3-hydroxy-phenyl)propionate hydroxylase
MEIERKAVYRVLLAGDAAHQMPPFAGQGMCSGIRDAANLAWKIAAVVQGEAGEAILDSYQQEREPHVRAIISTAIAMGEVVCILDENAAAGRNTEMLARKASGAQDVSVSYPDLVGGYLTDTPFAGALFPQPVASDGTRFDAVLGLSPVLISRTTVPKSNSSLRAFSLDAPEIGKFAEFLGTWLESANAEAVLIRPDRQVFGTGDAAQLLSSWAEIACLERVA